ncbi:MAG: hypothetical protein Q4D04_10785 [Clostridia bacterium]|nr:hypothetical protein [Clostridia bacterium]
MALGEILIKGGEYAYLMPGEAAIVPERMEFSIYVRVGATTAMTPRRKKAAPASGGAI